MPQAVKSKLFLYTDDCCLVFQRKHVIEIKKEINGDFAKSTKGLRMIESVFTLEKIRLNILFPSKRKIKKIPKLNIIYKNKKIKKLPEVTYLGCLLDETMSGESMPLKVINKINSRLKFLHRKKKF